ncbi:HAD family hydrolase [Pseudomonas sp. bs2935]|uniref:HAD family hydrolase n=1 Tax=Pseudomonas sp. bs2935 TaxID=1761895 RepID=UPI00087C3D96|nr:HAD family hydrolase [Pseudomonas sp. bs2935]SDR71771.1 FMN phosphatase YigB, HAD superfamily [Pseudomonas sp. bs2935]
MPVLAVVFDAFGTLVKIGVGTNPYRKILKLGIEQGRRPKATDAEDLLSMPMDLRQAADYFGISVETRFMNRLEEGLREELASIQAYPDGIAAVRTLQAAGLKVAICSNLAKPYASAIERLYPNLDGYAYSFAVGAIKPSFKIYQYVTQLTGTRPGEAWMIGDSRRCDCDGPLGFGMQGFYLDREGGGNYTNLRAFAEDILHKS